MSTEYVACFFRTDASIHVPGVGVTTKVTAERYRITREPGADFVLFVEKATGRTFEVDRECISVLERTSTKVAKDGAK
jgi:hypothetical protein